MCIRDSFRIRIQNCINLISHCLRTFKAGCRRKLNNSNKISVILVRNESRQRPWNMRTSITLWHPPRIRPPYSADGAHFSTTLTARCRSSFPLSTAVPIPAAAIRSISRKRMTTCLLYTSTNDLCQEYNSKANWPPLYPAFRVRLPSVSYTHLSL